jgi:hypothetical protein
VKYFCGVKTDRIMISSDGQTIIYNEVFVACLHMISLSGLGVRKTEGSTCVRKPS